MKGGSLIKKIIYSSVFLAAVPAILIMIFLPPLNTKSRLQVERVDKSSSTNVYEDLDSDTISEVIRTGKGQPYFFILVLNNDMQVYDQWNLQDSINLEMSDFFFGNFDHDRYKEIYIFTHAGDSLFLNINEFFDHPGIKSDHIFITKMRLVNKEVTSTVWPAGFFDTNGDGKDELFFSIQTGFGLAPRKVYSYDIVHKELKSSPLAGVVPQWPKMVDSDDDGRPEIFGLMGASGNYKTKVPFSDWSTWIMVFNDSLNFEFPPVEFKGLTNHMLISSYKNGSFKGYVVSHNTGSADTSVLKPRIMLYSLDGKKVRERLFRDLGQSFAQSTVLKSKGTDEIYLIGTELLELDNQLSVINKVKAAFNSYFFNYNVDIDFDGEDELLLYYSTEEKLVIYNTSLQKIAEAKLKGVDQRFRFSHYSSKEHENKIFLNAGGGYGYFLKLKRNSYYYLGFLVYPGIFMLILLFIILVKRINTLQVVQKESLNRRLVTLQLQGIKSQLDPHFTFNTLNSIASLIYLEDRHLAYDYMNKFTQLLRGLINDAERIYRSLGEELVFVTTYLDLEKLRYGDKFNYEIKIGESVSQREQVPKLVLHTFAENAIKHGIMSRAEGGILKIRVEKNKEMDYLILFIEDNGIGRARSEGQSNSTGKGLKLTGEFYDILNQINKKPIKHTILDLYNEKGDSVGTRVEVWVPVD
jgi:two-component sensor histidine kinase